MIDKKTEEKKTVNICWLRRDLRLHDNAALYKSLTAQKPTLVVFIFDKNILEKLKKQDARITFIYQTLSAIKAELQKNHSDLLVKYGTPEEVWPEILKDYQVASVFTNSDYEPYAKERDDGLAEYLSSEGVDFKSFKDQVIFDRDEVLKPDRTPYTVFTPYYKQWQSKLNDFYTRPYPTEKYFGNLLASKPLKMPSLRAMGFEESDVVFPAIDYKHKLSSYGEKRNFPALDATTHISLHLRFGTVSIRQLVNDALGAKSTVWLSELAWREFYMMILWHFPYAGFDSFKKKYDKIQWINDEKLFKAWCEGKTGYPIVDAGMRQLNETGFMHNRVRMIVASFLTKHLLTDWRWGEQYFAEKLLDYEMASNVGGWQWASGSGNDAAPYFRVFNPELQTQKFDPNLTYIKKWVPEIGTTAYPQPIIAHKFARERALEAYKSALAS
ncbi:deoxyribodipyrimidine photo-lyase [Pedobacter sp. UYEF25]